MKDLIDKAGELVKAILNLVLLGDHSDGTTNDNHQKGSK